MEIPVLSMRSKRSSKVALMTMAAFGGAAMLSACGGEPAAPAANAAKDTSKTEVEVYENVVACARTTGKSRIECDTMREQALVKAEKEAPRFAALQDCERQYGPGKCVKAGFGEEQTDGEGGHFSPFVVAWFSSGKNSNGPLFSDKADGYQTANGTRVSFVGSPAKYIVSNRAFERTKTVPKVKPASRSAKKSGVTGQSTGWNLSDRNGGSSKPAPIAEEGVPSKES